MSLPANRNGKGFKRINPPKRRRIWRMVLGYSYRTSKRVLGQSKRTFKMFLSHSLPQILCGFLLLQYRLFALLRKNSREIRSVLHISLISTKPYMLSRLLRDHGIHSDFFALNTDLVDRLNLGFDYHLPYRMNPYLRRLWEIYYLWVVLARYDVIHFHYNCFLSLGNGWELKFLKKMGKVLVFHFRGCDIRQRNINLAKNPGLNCCQECEYPEGSCDTEYQRSLLAKAKKYGDLFFVTTPDLKDFFPEAEHIPFISPYGIDLEKIQPVPKSDGVFRIVTSSNHPSLDGVSYIREAVKKMQREGYRVELIEVINKPFKEAISIYKSADLYASKLRMGYYNNSNIETLMMGIPNMSYIREEYRKNISDCPIIIASPENIYGKIREYFDQPQLLRTIGAKGPEFVKKYHDPHKIIDLMLRRYNEAFRAKKNFHNSV